MDLLERVIVNYETKGFEVKQRRKLKHGRRIYLKKELKGWKAGFYGIYLYYVDGNASVQSIRECLKDYVDFYGLEDFGKGDKGFLVCSAVEERLFRAMKRAKIENEEIRASIRPMVLTRTTENAREAESRRTVKEEKRVFIAHGRDRLPALELKVLIEDKYPIKAILLEKRAHQGKTLAEKLEKYSDVDYAFIILTPDDVGALKGESLRERGRQNVLLEWGILQGKIRRDNICLLIRGDVEIPSDLIGIGYYRFKDSVEECFLGIDNELRAAKMV